jgi:hypothetical protein
VTVNICYENTIEDMVVFNRHHCNHSPQMRRILAWRMWGPPVYVLAGFSLVALFVGSISLFVCGVFGSVASLCIARPLLSWELDRYVRRLYAEGRNQTTLGRHELELTAETLVERTSCTEAAMRLEAIERVVTDEGYTFIYVSAMAAHVVPQHAVLEGDYEAFVAALRERLVTLSGTRFQRKQTATGLIEVERQP